MKNDILYSSIDRSVNFIEKADDGFFESRYVHREDSSHFIAYLSSHNGCNKSCRFCHLTATGQTMMEPATGGQLIKQFNHVIGHYSVVPDKLQKLHVNFMARGEPLANPHITNPTTWAATSDQISNTARLYGINDTTFRISTIMPEETRNLFLEDVFCSGDEVIYYSLYSFQERFRKRWLPKAIDPNVALDKLASWQEVTDQEVKIHFSLIEGENDSMVDLLDLVQRVKSSGVRCEFNLVRFNSPDITKHMESSHLEDIGQVLSESFVGSKIIPRVGIDVHASCGVFYSPEV